MGKMSSYIITEISIRQATASITEQSKLCLKVTAMVNGDERSHEEWYSLKLLEFEEVVEACYIEEKAQ